MAPITLNNDWRKPETPQEALIIESWSQGVMLGSLMIMAAITMANMRKGVWLHKFILLELLLALTHGTFCFFSFKGYGWYLSGTAMLLYFSYWLHNVVAWMKIKPFLSRKWSWLYIGSVWASLPVVCYQIANNFRFFNNISATYLDVRPYEPLFRDPWWVLTTMYLLYIIHKVYDIPLLVLFKRGPRFGIMLVSMLFSIVFIVVDVVSSIVPNFSGKTIGINPYWKFALIFKCFCDTIILDDFKTALEKLRRGVFETYETVRFDDGDDSGLNRQRRGGFDNGGRRILNRIRTLSIPISPTRTRKSQRSDSNLQGKSSHLESTSSNDRSRSSRFSLNEEEIKEEVEVQEQSRHNRADHAREAVGKIGTKIAHLPGLAVGTKKNGAAGLPFSPSFAQTTSPPPGSTRRSMKRTSTRTSLSPSVPRKEHKPIPDPLHIPTDEELEADPTGNKGFEERRRIKTSRDESAAIALTASSVQPPHPGEPWGNFEGEEFDEPWGVNVAAKTEPRPSRSRSRRKSRADPEASHEEEEKISFTDAL